MNISERSILCLLKAAVTGECLPLPEGFSLDAALPQIHRHGLVTLAYEGALRCGIDRKLPTMQELFKLYIQAFMHSEGQMQELERVFAVFEENAIDYMPLKGCRLKALYPKPELRMMGDADVLVRFAQRDFVQKNLLELMSSLGYSFKEELEHVLAMKHPSLYIELHNGLIPNDVTDLVAYFGNGWKFATHLSGHHYVMRPEDEYVYLFSHFTKHYRGGGIGLRHVLDLWVYRSSYPQLDWNYVDTCFERLGLLRFHENILRLITYWFEDAKPEPVAEYLSVFIFSSGNWGTADSKALSKTLRLTGTNSSSLRSKLTYIFQTLFPPVGALHNKYPVLKRIPALLPVVWFIRPFHKLFFETSDFMSKSRAISAVSDESLRAHAEELAYVGLDYNF